MLRSSRENDLLHKLHFINYRIFMFSWPFPQSPSSLSISSIIRPSTPESEFLTLAEEASSRPPTPSMRRRFEPESKGSKRCCGTFRESMLLRTIAGSLVSGGEGLFQRFGITLRMNLNFLSPLNGTAMEAETPCILFEPGILAISTLACLLSCAITTL